MKKEIELVAHLYRRAGFGESRENIDMIAKDNYEGVVVVPKAYNFYFTFVNNFELQSKKTNGDLIEYANA